MPSVSRWSLVLSVPRLVIYVFVGILLLSWAMVGFGGYWGISLYQAYLQLKEENAQLTQKEMELDALRLTMKRIQRNEEIVHDALSQERKRMMESGLGQGGMPATAPSHMVSKDVLASGSMVPPAQSEHASILDQARGLQENMEELLEIIRERRELLNSTPSILPLDAQSYRITSRFGWRRSPFTGLKEFHDGLDSVGLARMIHKSCVVGAQDAFPRFLADVRKVHHPLPNKARQIPKIVHGELDVEPGIERPDRRSSRDGLVGKRTKPVDLARRKLGPNCEH